MTRLPGATAATLRRLLALARDLLQAPDPRSVLELTGPAIQELLLADGALLLLALGEQEHVTEFDRNGVMQTVREGTVLYRHARQAIDNQTPILLPDVAADPKLRDGGLGAGGTVSLLAFPFPRSSRLALWPSSGITEGVPTISPNQSLFCATSGNSRPPHLEMWVTGR